MILPSRPGEVRLDCCTDRVDEGDPSFRETEAVQIGAQPVARPRQNEGDTGGVELVDEVEDDVGGGGVDARDHGGVEDDPLDRCVGPPMSLRRAFRR